MPFTFGDEVFNAGDSTAVNCMVMKGDLPLSITWSLNSEPIINDENGMQVVKMSARLSSLSIDSITGHHRGIYKCVATNAAGSSESSAELVVNGILKFHQKVSLLILSYSLLIVNIVPNHTYPSLVFTSQFNLKLPHSHLVTSLPIRVIWPECNVWLRRVICQLRFVGH